MYSMVAVLSVLASASFVLAFVHGPAAGTCGCWGCGWCCCSTRTTGRSSSSPGWPRAGCGCGTRAGRGARRRAAGGRRGARVRAVGCRACSSRPATPRRRGRRGRRRSRCSRSPGVLFGFVAVPLLALGTGAALQRARPAEGTRLLALVGGVAALLAFLGSQLEPAWAPRYLAILFGPLLLALAAVLARGRRWTWAAAARRARRLARLRPGAGQEQRAHRGEHGDARAAAGRPRGLHAARAGAGARPLPAARPALRDAARRGRGAAGDRLARRPGAAARRAGGVRARPGDAPARARAPRAAGDADLPAPLAGAVEPRGAHPHARVAGVAGRAPGPALARPRAARDWPRPRSGVRTQLFEKLSG
jgi:hypothetical protein